MKSTQGVTRKKIAILLPSLSVGGAEQMVFNELSFLRHDSRFYFEIHIVFEPGRLYDKFKQLEIPICLWSAPHKKLRTIAIYYNIARYLRLKRFDIVHIHLMECFGPWIGRLSGLKVFFTVHSDLKYKLLQRFCMRRNDLIFGCGSSVLNNLKNFIPEKKIKLLNNAIGPITLSDVQPEEIFKRWGLCKDTKVVLSLGRLTKLKGFDLLIEAFHRVIEKESKVILLIGGEGPEKEKLEQQIKALGMQKHIRLLGLVNNVNELLEICDVYVNSSRIEGLPMTILEAMAHKKPIVATRVGGNSEVVKNGETGLLVAPEMPVFLTDAIVTLLEDDMLRKKLGEGAFALLVKNYTIEKHCEALALEYMNCP